MKQTAIYLATALLFLSACKREEHQRTPKIEEVESITIQNKNDDNAIQKYLEEHYFDNQGKIKAFSSTNTNDDNYPKLSDLKPIKLPSGVIVIIREGAQPTQGTEIKEDDIIHLMHKTTGFSSNDKGYANEITFASSVDLAGVPQIDPSFYYTPKSILEDTKKEKSYYEIEGFQEGLKHFKSFDKSADENYNMQGVIIVPSRVAFARDVHYHYNNLSWRNINFVFNFQVYKTVARK